MPSTKSRQKPKPNWQFEAIGTQWVIETPVALTDELRQKITKRIEAFDKTYSRFRDDSLVMQLTPKAGIYEFPLDVVEMITLYRKLYDATDGAVTPLVGDSLDALGYDKSYSLKVGKVKKPQAWDDVMMWDGRVVTTSQPVTLDFGAVGKGYLIDQVADILERNRIKDYVIDGSGDIRQRGDIQKVGLENPYDPTMVIGVADLHNASLCASATNRRQWGNGLHHVIDGRTGSPTVGVVATWVISDTTALSDGLATALFFTSVEELEKLGSFQSVRLFSDGHVEHTPTFVGQLYI